MLRAISETCCPPSSLAFSFSSWIAVALTSLASSSSAGSPSEAFPVSFAISFALSIFAFSSAIWALYLPSLTDSRDSLSSSCSCLSSSIRSSTFLNWSATTPALLLSLFASATACPKARLSTSPSSSASWTPTIPESCSPGAMLSFSSVLSVSPSVSSACTVSPTAASPAIGTTAMETTTSAAIVSALICRIVTGSCSPTIV